MVAASSGASLMEGKTNRQPFMTTFGRHNVVDVETALILRRVTSADAETTRPATSEQLSFRQAMLPRNTHSAKVVRKRELLSRLQDQCIPQRRTETKFQTHIPLVHLNIDMKMNAEPITGATAPRSNGSGPLSSKPPIVPTEQLRSAPTATRSDVAAVFQGFLAAHEASQAVAAVDKLPPSVIQSNPYLQHLRSNAEAALREAVELLVAASRMNARWRYEHADSYVDADVDKNPVADADLPQHCKALFSEWEVFLEMCSASTSEPTHAKLDPETERELFVSFIRTRGAAPMSKQQQGESASLGAEQHDSDAVVDAVVAATALTQDEHDVGSPYRGVTSQTPDALDDLAPPSGAAIGLAASDPTARAMVATRTRGTLTHLSAPLPRAKMMMDVHSKHEHLVRLMELSMLSSSAAPSSRATPTLPDDPTMPITSPLRRKSSSGVKTMAEVEHQAREVFSQIREEQTSAHVARAERQLEKHHQLGLRLNRSKNLDLYRLQQQEQHHRGLVETSHTSPQRSPPQHQQNRRDERRPLAEIGGEDTTAPNSPIAGHSRLPSSASLRSGPPSATHKLGGNPRAIGSAKSRPSSSGTNMSTPRGPTITLDLPTITFRTPQK